MSLRPHPSIITALRDGLHPFAVHQVFRTHGVELAKAQFDHLLSAVEHRGGPWPWGQLPDIEYGLHALEWPHRERLELLAVSVVSDVWGVDPAMLRPSLSGESLEAPSSQPTPREPPNVAQMCEIEKRIVFNLLIHGAAIHSLLTMHHMARGDLDQIGVSLFPLYDRVTAESLLSSWMMDYMVVAQMPEAAEVGGHVHINWAPTPVVEAKAHLFPYLLHELVKGVMETLSAHHLGLLDEKTLEQVYAYADRVEPASELMYFFVGPELWRRFLKSVSPRHLAESVAALAVQPPDVVDDIIIKVISDPHVAKIAIEQLLD